MFGKHFIFFSLIAQFTSRNCVDQFGFPLMRQANSKICIQNISRETRNIFIFIMIFINFFSFYSSHNVQLIFLVKTWKIITKKSSLFWKTDHSQTNKHAVKNKVTWRLQKIQFLTDFSTKRNIPKPKRNQQKNDIK